MSWMLSDADFNVILEHELDRVTFKDQATTPSPGANQVDVYVKDTAGRSMLWAVDDSGVLIRLAHDSVIVVRNASGSDMTKGQMVTLTGSTGNMPTVALAQANDPDTLADLVLMENIANGGFGYAAHVCMITINTIGLNEGDDIYLSPSTPGAYTTTEPTAAAAVYPQHVGIVTKVAAAGVIHFEIEGHSHPEHIWHGNLAGLSENDHTQYILHSLATAANDFLVASGSGTFVKKTLAETGAILEGDLDHGSIQGLSGDDHTQYILADATRAFSGTVIGKLTETIPEIVIDASAPGTTYPGLIWLDTDGVPSVGTIISDDDNDTKVEVEQSADADEVVITAGATEALTVKSTGIEVTGTVTIGATALSEANLIDLTDSGETSLHTHPAAAGADSTAIHDNVASEISAITEKTSPVSADMLVIEDSEAANVKKMLKLANLPGGFALESYVKARMSATMTNLSTNTFHDLQLSVEDTDIGSDFNISTYTFTAPSDGYYLFNCMAMLNQTNANVTGVKFQLVTSNFTWTHYESTYPWDSSSSYWPRQVDCMLWMDASDTAKLQVYQQGGSATIDVYHGNGTVFLITGPWN